MYRGYHFLDVMGLWEKGRTGKKEILMLSLFFLRKSEENHKSMGPIKILSLSLVSLLLQTKEIATFSHTSLFSFSLVPISCLPNRPVVFTWIDIDQKLTFSKQNYTFNKRVGLNVFLVHLNVSTFILISLKISFKFLPL